MKKITLLFTAISALYLVSCGNNTAGNAQKQKQFPKPGTVVAEAQMPITDDPINHFTFSVKVIADSDIANGVYDVDADYGPNYSGSSFTMPKGMEDAKPIIRKGSTPYTFIIGFRLPGDTAFNEYFQVSSTKTGAQMQYIKSYSF